MEHLGPYRNQPAWGHEHSKSTHTHTRRKYRKPATRSFIGLPFASPGILIGVCYWEHEQQALSEILVQLQNVLLEIASHTILSRLNLFAVRVFANTERSNQILIFKSRIENAQYISAGDTGLYLNWIIVMCVWRLRSRGGSIFDRR